MAEHSDELLFSWLNQRVERVSRLTTRHPLLTGALLAAAIAAASVIGLAIQHRITPAMLGFCAALCLPLLFGHRAPRLVLRRVWRSSRCCSGSSRGRSWPTSRC